MANSIAARPLPSQRHLFDIPDDVAFFNCAYLSPLPNASLSAGERGLRRKAQPWTIAPLDFFSSSEAVRKLFAGRRYRLRSGGVLRHGAGSAQHSDPQAAN